MPDHFTIVRAFDASREAVFDAWTLPEKFSVWFGTAAVALTLILTPMLADKSKSSVFASVPTEFDNITTGSIPKTENGKRYTIRRSVLQESPGSVCVVQGYGSGAGC